MTWVSLFNRAELGDYRLPVGSGIGSPLFVSLDAPGCVFSPLPGSLNTGLLMTLDYAGCQQYSPASFFTILTWWQPGKKT